MLLGTLGSSVLGNLETSTDTTQTGKRTINTDEEINGTGQDFYCHLML